MSGVDVSRILVFSRTLVFRHESIPHAAEVITGLATEDGHQTDHTEDPAVFTDAGLEPYRLVVWLSTSGEVLDDDQRRAFARWLADGGSYAGVHGATTGMYGWPEYERIAGAVFDGHPDVQTATVSVTGPAHPSTAGLPGSWVHTDEWYNFRRRPTADHTVLLTVDEATYTGGTMGAEHPIAWHGRYGRGRTWYTALGHSVEGYDDPLLRAHLLGGLRSVLGAPGDPEGQPWSPA